MSKIFYLYDRFKSQIEIILLNMLKLLKILGILSYFCSKFQVFSGKRLLYVQLA